MVGMGFNYLNYLNNKIIEWRMIINSFLYFN